MSDPTWVSILPPVLAIVLAIATRQVYLSLAGGIWLGWAILEGWQPFAGLGASIDATVGRSGCKMAATSIRALPTDTENAKRRLAAGRSLGVRRSSERTATATTSTIDNAATIAITPPAWTAP